MSDLVEIKNLLEQIRPAINAMNKSRMFVGQDALVTIPKQHLLSATAAFERADAIIKEQA